MPFAKIDGRELHYTDYPPGSHPGSSGSEQPVESAPLNLIFVHGLGSTQNYFGPILPFLSRYRCVTFDNYAAGRSKYVEERHPDTSIEQIATDVLGLMDHLKIQQAVIVGYSMGGMVPTTIAASKKGAERIIGGVCIGPVHPSEAVAGVFEKRIATVNEGGMETMANTIPSAATGPNATVLQKSFIREMLLGQNPKGYIANCRAIATAKPPDYAAVQCPMLIIVGEMDKSAPVTGAQLIHDKLGTTNKKLEILEKMGHWYCVEDGETVGKMVKGFCEGIEK